VRDNLANLTEEIGYSPSRPSLSQLKERSIEGVATTKTAINVMVKQVQDYVAEIRRRREAQDSVRFHESTVTPAMMMRRDEQFILDAQNAADPSLSGDNPCRADGPQSDPPDLQLSA
jgi:2-methylisocitrate lyase-like PEP mutase family enzyme